MDSWFCIWQCLKNIFAKNSAKNNQFQQKIEICKLHIGLHMSGVSGWLILLHMITKHHFRVSKLHKRQKRCILLGVTDTPTYRVAFCLWASLHFSQRLMNIWQIPTFSLNIRNYLWNLCNIMRFTVKNFWDYKEIIATHIYTHTYTHTNIYICIYIYMYM